MSNVQSVTKGRASARQSPHRMVIDGESVSAESGNTFALTNPATEEIFTDVPEGDANDVDRAVRAARLAFDDGRWRDMGDARRGEILWKVGDLIDRHCDELSATETRSMGMPSFLGRAVTTTAAATFRYWAGWCTRVHGRTTGLSDPTRSAYAHTVSEPVGVCALITPWNAGLLTPANKLGPALAAGCTAVLKPAENTPLSSLRLGELMLEAGVPKGVVNVVTGFGRGAGAALTAHPDVDKISFTGSVAVGRQIVHASAEKFKRVTLELGGKSPFLIFDDADIDGAVASASLAIFMNSGQSCVAGSRLYVQRTVYQQVVEKIAKRAREIRIGDGFVEGTEMGPLVSEKQMKRVLGYIQTGLEEGAAIVAGGQRSGNLGYFVQPTVFADVNAGMTIVCEEIFGPVLTVSVFDDVEEAIRLGNSTDYGLAGYIWTNDIRRAQHVAQRLRAGIIWVNTAMLTDPSVPFGGYKQSGIGRECGIEAMQPYLETKSIVFQEWPPSP
jgi:phenylacetaldehyde dehydrogenase